MEERIGCVPVTKTARPLLFVLILHSNVAKYAKSHPHVEINRENFPHYPLALQRFRLGKGRRGR